ncbi:hypothetical protein OIV83_003120 [Microbotryomycetes sp. JL201]|nr:hypothetical protein OIV83_003120 [Microbotryomycetes sp. JL201]
MATSSSQGQVVRPSSLSIRPQLGVATRIRSRSINSGPSTPRLSPTLKGSPVLGHDETDDSRAFIRSSSHDGRAASGSNGLGKATPGRSILSRTLSSPQLHQSSSSSDDDDNGSLSDAPTLEEEATVSTASDTPPPTPINAPTFQATTEWSALAQPRNKNKRQQRRRSKTTVARLTTTSTTAADASSRAHESPVRQILRRGRSFTTLFMNPLSSPKLTTADRPDPILELKETKYSPPLPSSQEEDFQQRYAPQPSSSNAILQKEETHRTIPSAPFVDATSSSSYGVSSAVKVPSTPKTLKSFVPQLVILAFLFVGSFVVVAALIATLPNLFIPHALADLPALTSALSTYRTSSFLAELHLFSVLTVLFLWKQCFSIPGSVLTNVLFGALYGTGAGTLITCLWTATGSTGAYFVAVVVSDLVEYYFAKPLAVTRRALNLPDPSLPSSEDTVPLSTGDLFSHLLLARFFPLLPYSVLNVISGVLRLPVPVFFITLVIGSFPFNFVTVSVGQLVAIAATDPSKPLVDKIWSSDVLIKLVLVTIVSVVPLVFKKQIQQVLSSQTVATAFQSLPVYVKYLFDRARDAIARKIFGFGIVVHGRSSSAPSSSQPYRRVGQVRRKWNRSWQGDDWAMERLGEGSHVSRSLLSRWDGDEGDCVELMQQEEGESLMA